MEGVTEGSERVQGYAGTRDQLRGVAESLIAGPQYRAAGTIRLAVRPDGFAATALPLAVHGTTFTWQDDRAELAGPVGAVAAAAGLDYGPPDGAYRSAAPMPADTVLDLNPEAAALLYRSLYAGGFALTQVLPDGHPVLWPEHFDVAVAADQVTYGVAAGDDLHPLPYAYVAPFDVTAHRGPFFNAPFGALRSLDPTADVDALAAQIADFLAEGRGRLEGE